MSESPLAVFETLDPELLDLLAVNRKSAFEDGALPLKYKFLIAMAMDAAMRIPAGINSLAQSSMQAGATKQEVVEAVRVIQYVGGISSIFPVARALRNLF